MERLGNEYKKDERNRGRNSKQGDGDAKTN